MDDVSIRDMYRCVAAAIAMTLSVSVSRGFAAQLTVDDDGPADHATLQAAINAAAASGDEIVVQPGTYIENINTIGKAIVIRSDDPSDPAVVAATIVDGGAAGSTITINSGEEADTVIRGLTVTNGTAMLGGGIMIDTCNPRIEDCVLRQNHATLQGGGLYVFSSSAQIRDCTFELNTCDTFGGGVFAATHFGPMSRCMFRENTAVNGGGMYRTNSSSVVSGCLFIDNIASDGGGGLALIFASPTLDRCTFQGNEAGGSGGGLFAGAGSTVTNCVVTDNTASAQGGGVFVSSATSPFFPEWTNCTIANNTSGSGGGIYVDVPNVNLRLANSVIWGNTPDQLILPGTPTVSYTDVQGGFSGTGNIAADPLFLDDSGGDYRLSPGSPAIDAANNSAPNIGGSALDAGGEDRFEDDPATVDSGLGSAPVIDMGAHEFQPTLPPACNGDATGNNTVDVNDLNLVLGNFGAMGIAGIPGDVTADGKVDINDLNQVIGNFGTVCP